jgi:hypothetical protein
MPAEAGIQAAINLNHFKARDSRLRGIDGGSLQKVEFDENLLFLRGLLKSFPKTFLP